MLAGGSPPAQPHLPHNPASPSPWPCNTLPEVVAGGPGSAPEVAYGTGLEPIGSDEFPTAYKQPAPDQDGACGYEPRSEKAENG